MRIRWAWCAIAVCALVAIATSTRLSAYPEMSRQTKAACAACHTSPAGGTELTAAGKSFKTAKKPPGPATGADYVGMTRCAGCHPAQHAAWKETAHAQSLELLKTATPERAAAFAKKVGVKLTGKPADNPACLRCHVTGLDLAGGYPAADSLKNATLSVVGCEACHGPGGRHVVVPMGQKKQMINGAVSAKLCTQCHTPATDPTFDFEKARAKGVHSPPPPPKSDG